MKKLLNLFMVFLVSVSLTACATGSLGKADEGGLSDIVLNVTTTEWVGENIGTPQEVRAVGCGRTILVYDTGKGMSYFDLVKITVGKNVQLESRSMVITIKGGTLDNGDLTGGVVVGYKTKEKSMGNPYDPAKKCS